MQLNEKIFELEQASYALKQERDILDNAIQQHTHLSTRPRPPLARRHVERNILGVSPRFP
jgi:hypothetical protein